jgi:hypothetical protein
MIEKEISFRVNLESEADAQAIATEVNQLGGSAKRTDEKGILPLVVVLAVVLPPGIAILANVINHIVHSWRDHGVLIDARGTGAPSFAQSSSIPYGTVIILTRDGETSKRTDIADVDLSKYIAEAVKAVSGGASATSAKASAEALIAA